MVVLNEEKKRFVVAVNTLFVLLYIEDLSIGRQRLAVHFPPNKIDNNFLIPLRRDEEKRETKERVERYSKSLAFTVFRKQLISLSINFCFRFTSGIICLLFNLSTDFYIFLHHS